MLRISSITQKDFNGVALLAIGDGVSSSMVIKLNKAPFLINFQGNTPVAAVVTAVGQAGVSATAEISTVGLDTLLTINFSEAIQEGMTDVSVAFEYSAE